MSKTIKLQEVAQSERHITEEFRLAALEYVEADAAATLLEELKTATLAQMKSALIVDRGEMPDSRADRIVRSGADWKEYVEKMVEARAKANKLKLELEWIRMRERMQDRESWLQRSERRMGRSVT